MCYICLKVPYDGIDGNSMRVPNAVPLVAVGGDCEKSNPELLQTLSISLPKNTFRQ